MSKFSVLQRVSMYVDEQREPTGFYYVLKGQHHENQKSLF